MGATRRQCKNKHPDFIKRSKFINENQNFVAYGNGLYITWRDYVIDYAANNELLIKYSVDMLTSIGDSKFELIALDLDYAAAMRSNVKEGRQGKIKRFRRFLVGDFDYVDDNILIHGTGKCITCGGTATHGHQNSVSDSNPYGVATVCKLHSNKESHVCVETNICKHTENGKKCGSQASWRLVGTTKYTHCSKHKTDIDGPIEDKSPYCIGAKWQPCPNHTVATFGEPGATKRLLCKRCNIEGQHGYVDVVNRMCPSVHMKNGKRVTRQACFNMPGETAGMYCEGHSKPGMMNVKAPHCKRANCNIYPSYGIPNGPALYCAAHQLPGMKHLYGRLCLECDKQCSFGDRINKIPLYCYAHKKEDMKDVVSKKCELCDSQPYLAPIGSVVATRCGKHRVGTMRNIRDDMCTYPGCETRACFAETQTGRAIYCAEHKIGVMFNVKDKYCAACSKEYAKWGETKRTHCRGCKTDKMKLCSGRLCKKCKLREAIYNKEGMPPKFCASCKEGEMIDTKSKRCEAEGCKTTASYGKLFQPATHCAKHSNGNQYTNRRPVCVVENCNEGAVYAIGINYPTICENHFMPNRGYVNVAEIECIKCKYTYVLNEQNPICNTCQGIVKGYEHLKEKRIEEVLNENNIHVTIRDIPVDPALCPRKRPDFGIDCGTHIVIIEVDEGQHNHIPVECENTRMGSIYNAFGLRCMVFIRYNPDNYIDSYGNKIYGKSVNPSREILLVNMIKNLMVESRDGLWSVKLFYDGYNGTPKFVEHDYRGRPL